VKKTTREDFIFNSKKKFGNRFSYENFIYKGLKNPCVITCSVHGEINTTPKNHLQSETGCKKCSLDKRRVSFDVFVKRSNKIHKNKYTYPVQKITKIDQKIKIVCPTHGEFFQIGSTHQTGGGCVRCGRDYMGVKQTKTKEQFIKDSVKTHGNYYDYSKVNYQKSNIKVEIICPKHGPFFQRPNTHLNGSGCNSCGYEIVSKKNKKSWSDFLTEVRRVHGRKYVYQKSSYKNGTNKIKVFCKTHKNYFEIRPSFLLRGQGCYYCGIEKIQKFLTKDWKSTLELIKKVHGEKYDYNPSTFKSQKQTMEILCKKHGPFQQSPEVHRRGHGCPNCNSSIGENSIELYLITRKIKFKQQHTFEGLKMKRKLKCDFYLPKLKIVIEYNGRQHYEPVESFGGETGLERTKKSDKLKRDFLIKEGIRLIVVRFDEDINNKLDKELGFE
jgi:very-short-patch-repair endonuclease